MDATKVGKIGYGLMMLTLNPMRKLSQEDFNDVLKTVLDNRGFSEPLFINTGEFYGMPDPQEGIEKLGAFFHDHPEYADDVYLSVKGGIDHQSWLPDPSTKNLQRALDAIKLHLQPLYDARKKRPRTLDMFTLSRVGDRPIEETLEDLKKFQEDGYFDQLCLSEVGATTIAKAASIVRLAAVEIEFSLFVPDAAKNGVFAILKKYDIPAICYSPLAMGLLTEKAPYMIDENGTAFGFDRFKEEYWKHNAQLLESVKAIAAKLDITPAKLALSYIASLSNTEGHPHLIPIPGSTDAERQLENLKVVELPPAIKKEIEELLAHFERQGARYNATLDGYLWA